MARWAVNRFSNDGVQAVLGHAQQHPVFFGAAYVHRVVGERLHEGPIDLRFVDRREFHHSTEIVPASRGELN